MQIRYENLYRSPRREGNLPGGGVDVAAGRGGHPAAAGHPIHGVPIPGIRHRVVGTCRVMVRQVDHVLVSRHRDLVVRYLGEIYVLFSVIYRSL